MICSYCDKEFNITNRHGGTNRRFCYECIPNGLGKREGNKLRNTLFFSLSNKEKLIRGCDICGYNKCEAALEWHHKDSSIKEYNPSALRNTSFTKYKKEIDKCLLLCANCHREVHTNAGVAQSVEQLPCKQ